MSYLYFYIEKVQFSDKYTWCPCLWNSNKSSRNWRWIMAIMRNTVQETLLYQWDNIFLVYLCCDASRPSDACIKNKIILLNKIIASYIVWEVVMHMISVLAIIELRRNEVHYPYIRSSICYIFCFWLPVRWAFLLPWWPPTECSNVSRPCA